MNKFSDPEKILQNFCNEEKEKTCKEIENAVKDFKKTKEDLINETKEVFKYNTCNLKIPAFDLKYKLELLNRGDPDYDVLESSLSLNSKTETFEDAVVNKVSKLQDDRNAYKIYRVKSTEKTLQEPKGSGSSSLLLLHGTKGPCVEGILKEGFRPSKSGSFGPGVYLTNSFNYALKYGSCFVNDEGIPKKVCYLFVNKVRRFSTNTTSTKLRRNTQVNESRKQKFSFAIPKPSALTYKSGKKVSAPRFFKPPSSEKVLQDYANNEPDLKVFECTYSKIPTTFKDSPLDAFDSQNNKIPHGTFHYDLKNEKFAVAHHDLVTPAYLIEVEGKKSVQEVVESVLYKKLFVDRFSKPTSTKTKQQSLSKILTNKTSLKMTSEYTSEQFYSELQAEIETNQRAQVESIKSKFDDKIALITQQLSFKVSSLFKTTFDSSIMHKTEELKPTNEDYQFIFNLVSDETSEKNKKVLHIFRINPVDQNEERKIHNACLYLHGVKSDKVVNILQSGYPKSWESYDKKCEKECIREDIFLKKKCSCLTSNELTKELFKGTSFCTLEGDVRKLSFVFVLGHGKANMNNDSGAKRIRLSGEKHHENAVCGMERILKSDSRGCSTLYGSFTNPSYGIPSIGMVPAYLIVFNT